MSDVANIQRCGDLQMACIVIVIINDFVSEYLRLNYHGLYFWIGTVKIVAMISFYLSCLLNIIFAIHAKSEIDKFSFGMLLFLNSGLFAFLLIKAFLAG